MDLAWHTTSQDPFQTLPNLRFRYPDQWNLKILKSDGRPAVQLHRARWLRLPMQARYLPAIWPRGNVCGYPTHAPTPYERAQALWSALWL